MRRLGDLVRAVPARAQRALHALQEPRRRQAGQVLPAALLLPTRRGIDRGGWTRALDLDACASRVARRTRRSSGRAVALAPAPRTSSWRSCRRCGRAGDGSRRPAAPRRRRSSRCSDARSPPVMGRARSSRQSAALGDVFDSTSVRHAPDPGRHRRHARAAHGRPGDPRLPDRRRAVDGARGRARLAGRADLDAPGLRDSPRRQATSCSELVDWCDIIVFQGHFLHESPVAERTRSTRSSSSISTTRSSWSSSSSPGT